MYLNSSKAKSSEPAGEPADVIRIKFSFRLESNFLRKDKNLSPSDHGEAVVAGEVRRARKSCDRLFAGVDQIRVDLKKFQEAAFQESPF